MSWDYAKPLREHDPDCYPCLFLQFAVSEGGMRVSKMLQVFSRQVMIFFIVVRMGKLEELFV
jgi:hypothetical protein